MSVLGKRYRDGNLNKNVDELKAPPHKKTKVDECKNDKQENDVSGLDAAFPNEEANKVIVLNVGGIKYTTTIQTLTGYNSMLKARFSSKYAMNPSEDGSYFIDRNGELFTYILEHFRNGELLLPTTWNKHDIYKFYLEVKYYMVESLIKPVLLKLFNSVILTDDRIKMKILDKISKDAFNHLNEWKLKYEYDESKFTGRDITSSEFTRNQIRFESLGWCKKYLLLVEGKNQIYGMFVSKRIQNNTWFYEFENSFAFSCGPNGVMRFDNVRTATENEKSSNQSKHTVVLQDLYPLLIYGYDEGFQAVGDFVLKYIAHENITTLQTNVAVSKMEFWLIPTL